MAKQDLQLVLLPGRGPAPGGAEYYLEAYRLWKLVWKATLLELDGSDELYSDHFTRQDYVLCLFHGARCVALTCFRRADLGYATHQEDSWFKPWPKEMLDQIGRELRQGLVVSWVTIDPDYRRTQANAYTKDLEISPRLAEALNFFMRDCEVDIAFGVTRNNRSVNKFCAYAGSQALQTNASYYEACPMA